MSNQTSEDPRAGSGAAGGAAVDPGLSGRGVTRLSRDAILRAAIGLIDSDGLAKLTMRRVGDACGVEAMALYRYVHGRGDLLSAIVDHIVDELYDDQLAARRQEDGWQDYLMRLAHGVRRIALDHPYVFPLIATEAPQAPWVRPPLRSLRWMETFLGTLIGYGFEDLTAVSAYRTYTTFLVGRLLQEVSVRGAKFNLEEASVETKKSQFSLSDYPHLHRLQARLSEDHSRDEFEEMLEIVLDRLELLKMQQH